MARTMTELFDNIDVPLLDIGDKLGFTKYIDFIRPEEVHSPVMKGVDILLRPFIVVKAIVDNSIVMETFFQRYTNNNDFWMGCGYWEYISTYGAGIDENQLQFLEQLITTGQAKLTEQTKPINNLWKDKDVYIYDEKKWEAAKVIQRYWRQCRYDPKYKMCSKVLFSGLKQIQDDHGVNLIDLKS